jgi:hypothetical protein
LPPRERKVGGNGRGGLDLKRKGRSRRRREALRDAGRNHALVRQRQHYV